MILNRLIKHPIYIPSHYKAAAAHLLLPAALVTLLPTARPSNLLPPEPAPQSDEPTATVRLQVLPPATSLFEPHLLPLPLLQSRQTRPRHGLSS